MAKAATERFGPIGIGWGYEILEERLDDAGPIYHEGDLLCQSKLHTIKLRLWYKHQDGDKLLVGDLIQFGHTKYIYKSSRGFSTDWDVAKKSLTDAMKKCLSLLGFCADIFTGQFDDQDYVEHQKDKERIKNADDKAEEITKQELEYKQWISDTVRLMRESKQLPMLEGIYKTAVRKADARNDKTTQRTLAKVKDEMIAILKGNHDG